MHNHRAALVLLAGCWPLANILGVEGADFSIEHFTDQYNARRGKPCTISNDYEMSIHGSQPDPDLNTNNAT
jgi:hypothetical protein